MTTASSHRLRHDPAALKAARKAAGFTQVQLAAAAGCSQPYLSLLESGAETPGGRLLAALADALGVPADSLRARKA